MVISLMIPDGVSVAILSGNSRVFNGWQHPGGTLYERTRKLGQSSSHNVHCRKSSIKLVLELSHFADFRALRIALFFPIIFPVMVDLTVSDSAIGSSFSCGPSLESASAFRFLFG